MSDMTPEEMREKLMAAARAMGGPSDQRLFDARLPRWRCETHDYMSPVGEQVCPDFSDDAEIYNLCRWTLVAGEAVREEQEGT